MRHLFNTYIKSSITGFVCIQLVLIIMIQITVVNKTINDLKVDVLETKSTIIEQHEFITHQENLLADNAKIIIELEETLKDASKPIIENKSTETTSIEETQSAVATAPAEVAASNSGQFLNQYTNLYTDTPASIDELNQMIEWWAPRVRDGKRTPFEGRGDIFYKAWQETGLDPVYILSHASWESGWGWYHFDDKYNYFGIYAYDSDPNKSLDMGNNLEEGIINGAKWIKENYYDNGNISLAHMVNAGYASADGWSTQIASTANTCLKVVK